MFILQKNETEAREPLTLCVEYRATESIKQAAQCKNDYHILSLLSKDLIAAEAHYHQSCYKLYTKVNYIEKKHETIEL